MRVKEPKHLPQFPDRYGDGEGVVGWNVSGATALICYQPLVMYPSLVNMGRGKALPPKNMDMNLLNR